MRRDDEAASGFSGSSVPAGRIGVDGTDYKQGLVQVDRWGERKRASNHVVERMARSRQDKSARGIMVNERCVPRSSRSRALADDEERQCERRMRSHSNCAKPILAETQTISSAQPPGSTSYITPCSDNNADNFVSSNSLLRPDCIYTTTGSQCFLLFPSGAPMQFALASPTASCSREAPYAKIGTFMP